VDTGLSDHSKFKDLWADHPYSTVPPLLVVVELDVLKHLAPHIVSRFKLLPMDRFNFETLEEAFGTGIIIAVAFGAYAALKLMPGKQRLVESALTTSVRMHDHAFGHFAFS
jgi:hypothetical protein